MNVYFIRHAQTEYNFKGVYQPAEAGLSLCGVKQAQKVSRRIANFPIELILCSPQKRARETAKIINSKLKKEVRYLYLLGEVRRPSKIIGKHKKSELSHQVSSLFFKNALNPRWYYADEENFSDLLGRAKRTIKYLSQLKQKNILVITHSTFLKLLIANLMLGDGITAEYFRHFVRFLSTKNTGITICERKKSGMWRLDIWNDYTHLEGKNKKGDVCDK